MTDVKERCQYGPEKPNMILRQLSDNLDKKY